MMKLMPILLALIGNIALAGGGSGGTPPALQDQSEIISIHESEFNALAIDAIKRQPLNIGGKLFKPQRIDLEARTIEYQALDSMGQKPLLIREDPSLP